MLLLIVERALELSRKHQTLKDFLDTLYIHVRPPYSLYEIEMIERYK